MRRFKKYIDRHFVPANAKEPVLLRASGLKCEAFPEPMGIFEEVEFSADLNGAPLVMCIAVAEGHIKRIMFFMRKSDDPDDVRPLSEVELKDLADQKGDQLVHFFESITR